MESRRGHGDRPDRRPDRRDRRRTAGRHHPGTGRRHPRHVDGGVRLRALTPGGLFLARPRPDRRARLADAAVAAGAVAVLAARPVGVRRSSCPGSRRGTPIPERSSTTATARVPRCWRRWPPLPPRWPPTWSRGLRIVGITGPRGRPPPRTRSPRCCGRWARWSPARLVQQRTGPPWTVLRATRDTDFLVLEIPARHPATSPPWPGSRRRRSPSC